MSFFYQPTTHDRSLPFVFWKFVGKAALFFTLLLVLLALGRGDDIVEQKTSYGTDDQMQKEAAVVHIGMVFATRPLSKSSFYSGNRFEEAAIAIHSIRRATQACKCAFHFLSTPQDASKMAELVDFSIFDLYDFVNLDNAPTAAWFGSFYSGPREDGRQDAFFKLTIEGLLPGVSRALVLDTDTLVTHDLCKSWRDVFGRFQPSTLFALASDLFRAFRKDLIFPKHISYAIPQTQSFFQTTPSATFGINSGVLFMNLDRMRSIGWNSLWRNELIKYVENVQAPRVVVPRDTSIVDDVFDTLTNRQIERAGLNLQKACDMCMTMIDQGVFNLVAKTHPNLVLELDNTFNFVLNTFVYSGMFADDEACTPFRRLVCRHDIKIWHANVSLYYQMHSIEKWKPFREMFWKSTNPDLAWVRHWQMCDMRLAIVLHGRAENVYKHSQAILQNQWYNCDIDLILPAAPNNQILSSKTRRTIQQDADCPVLEDVELLHQKTIRFVSLPDHMSLANLWELQTSYDEMLVLNADTTPSHVLSTFDLCVAAFRVFEKMRASSSFLGNSRTKLGMTWTVDPVCGDDTQKYDNAQVQNTTPTTDMHVLNPDVLFCDLRAIREDTTGRFLQEWKECLRKHEPFRCLQNSMHAHISSFPFRKSAFLWFSRFFE